VTSRSQVWKVALWEFGRFYKWRGELFALAIAFLATLGLTWLGGQRTAESIAIGWSDPSGQLGEPPPEFGPYELVRLGADEDPQAALESTGLAGVLVWNDAWSARLVTASDPEWAADLGARLTPTLYAARAAALGLQVDQLGQLLLPVELNTEVEADDGPSRSRKLAALLVVGFLAMGVFTSMAYQFSAITGEKQARITELVVSAIGPQTWIDGKLIGVTLLSLQGVIGQTTAVYLGYRCAHWIGGTRPAPLDALPTLLALAPLALLGLLFWNAFLAAIAATIDDPQTSSRSGVMLLPTLIIGMPLVLLTQLDEWPGRLLSWFPPTAPGALAARFGLGQAPWLDLAVGCALLGLAAWAARRAAGRVFAATILLHGSEPSWGRIWRFARRG
jgi:ABC-2 type transport system permease protein